jgi:two-component system response regulator AtoC
LRSIRSLNAIILLIPDEVPVKEQPVLVVDADPATRQQLSSLLHQWGYAPVSLSSLQEVSPALGHVRFLFSLVDGGLGDAEQHEKLRQFRIQGWDPGPIIMLWEGKTGDSRMTPMTSGGAEDVIQKPVNPEELQRAIKGILSWPRPPWGQAPADEATARLEQEISLWRSPKMREACEIIQQAARVDVTVLVCGETGTGKDLVVRAIHHLSSRQGRPFVKVNCAAVPRELLESELFGHERGAFTGAHQLKIGKFEHANHGTIFLDEVGDLHPALQAKLLHVLQDGEFSRVGGKCSIKVDLRIIAATNQELDKAVKAGRFRDDLYYRLNVIQIVVPPLRERTEEIPLLIKYFAERYAKEFRREGFSIPPSVMERLVRHSFPGNIRELENIVKRMIVLDDPFTQWVLPSRGRPEQSEDGPLVPGRPEPPPLREIGKEAARVAEREAIAKALKQTGWNRAKAAKILKISYRALLYKIKDAGLDRERPPSYGSGI